MISSCFICFAPLLLQIHPLGHKTNSTRFSSRRCFCFFLPCCTTVFFFCATRKCLYEGRCNIGAMEPSTLKFSVFLVENKNVSWRGRASRQSAFRRAQRSIWTITIKLFCCPHHGTQSLPEYWWPVRGLPSHWFCVQICQDRKTKHLDVTLTENAI